jgi:sugar phosphate isomerase/epimerase
MAELSMNETTTFRWSFEEDVANYARAGIPAVGVWRQKLSDCGESKAAELLAQSGLKASHLLWAGGFTGSDGRSYRASVEDAKEALRTAAELGAGSLVVYSGARAGHTFNHARRLIKEALRELAPLAAELGVFLAVEPMHPGCAAEFTFLTTIDDVLWLVEVVESPQVKMVFDTYHLGFSEDVIRRVPEIAPHVAIVQLGDGRHPPTTEQNRCRLGAGVIPLREIVAALVAAGYNGYFDVELLGEEIETTDYHDLLEHAKAAFQELVLGAQES